MAVEHGARRKADHHPIDKNEEHDDERERAVKLFFVRKFEVEEKRRRGDDPKYGRKEAAGEGIKRLSVIGKDVRI